MDEDKQEEKKEEPEVTTPAEDAGVQPTTTPFLDLANTTAERIEKAAKEINEAQDRREAYDARIALGGHTEAGQKAPVESEEEKYNKDAKERYAGTGLDPTPDDTPTTFQ